MFASSSTTAMVTMKRLYVRLFFATFRARPFLHPAPPTPRRGRSLIPMRHAAPPRRREVGHDLLHQNHLWHPANGTDRDLVLDFVLGGCQLRHRSPARAGCAAAGRVKLRKKAHSSSFASSRCVARPRSRGMDESRPGHTWPDPLSFHNTTVAPVEHGAQTSFVAVLPSPASFFSITGVEGQPLCAIHFASCCSTGGWKTRMFVIGNGGPSPPL